MAEDSVTTEMGGQGSSQSPLFQRSIRQPLSLLSVGVVAQLGGYSILLFQDPYNPVFILGAFVIPHAVIPLVLCPVGAIFMIASVPWGLMVTDSQPGRLTKHSGLRVPLMLAWGLAALAVAPFMIASTMASLYAGSIVYDESYYVMQPSSEDHCRVVLGVSSELDRNSMRVELYVVPRGHVVLQGTGGGWWVPAGDTSPAAWSVVWTSERGVVHAGAHYTTFLCPGG